MTLRRTHILLDPEQHKALANLARREGRSISDLTREIVQSGIEQRQHLMSVEQGRRLEAMEKARSVRQAILLERGGKPLDLEVSTLINEMREERDAGILNRGD